MSSLICKLSSAVCNIFSRLAQVELTSSIRSTSRNIYTEAQLVAALGETGPRVLYLRSDIILRNITYIQNLDKTIVFNDWRIVQGITPGQLILFGPIVADRQQIFTSFTAGQIIGHFGRNDIYPEWWGLQANNHDIAINCAIKASSLVPNGYSVNVSLAPRTYDVSAPLDLSSTAASLIGSGSSLTFINTTTAWNASFIKAEVWGAATGPVNHAAVVWIGGDLTADEGYNARTYHTKVKGLSINCYNAAFIHRAGGIKRVSGISSKFWVEECSVIHDVTVSNASGFGIGFCRHKGPGANWTGGATGAAVINGLDISSCWILGATFRDFYGLYFSEWTNNCTVSNTTVDIGLAKSISVEYGVDTSDFDTTIIGETTYPAPDWIRDYPHTAIYAGGYVTLTDIHIEGSVIGVFIPEIGGGNNVSCTNVKTFALMDRALNAVYELDGRSGRDPSLEVPNAINNTDVYGYGCAVLIAGAAEPVNINNKGCATISCISGLVTTYLLRDSAYGKHTTTFGQGQFPQGAGIGGRLAFYSRGNNYGRQTTSPYNLIGQYNVANPTDAASTSRQFFIGPIY
jgi:hypothetical protein